jgi:hypothetical protein
VVLKVDQPGFMSESCEHRVEEVLRATFPFLRALRWALLAARRRENLSAELVAGERCDPSAILRIVTVVAGILNPVDDSPPTAELHRADTDHVHTRLVDHSIAFID